MLDWTQLQWKDQNSPSGKQEPRLLVTSQSTHTWSCQQVTTGRRWDHFASEMTLTQAVNQLVDTDQGWAPTSEDRSEASAQSANAFSENQTAAAALLGTAGMEIWKYQCWCRWLNSSFSLFGIKISHFKCWDFFFFKHRSKKEKSLTSLTTIPITAGRRSNFHTWCLQFVLNVGFLLWMCESQTEGAKTHGEKIYKENTPLWKIGEILLLFCPPFTPVWTAKQLSTLKKHEQRAN